VPPGILAPGLREFSPPGWRPLAGGPGGRRDPSSEALSAPHLDGVLKAVGVRRSFGNPSLWERQGEDPLHGRRERPGTGDDKCGRGEHRRGNDCSRLAKHNLSGEQCCAADCQCGRQDSPTTLGEHDKRPEAEQKVSVDMPSIENTCGVAA